MLGAGIAFTGLAAGFVEEMVFRGIILNILKDKWNTKIAVLVTSLLFGIVHIIRMDFSLVSCLLVLVAGTMAGIEYQSPQSGRLYPDKTNESRVRHS